MLRRWGIEKGKNMGKLEEIEREVRAEAKADLLKADADSEIFAKIEAATTKKFRLKYFEILESHVVALDFNSNRNKEYVRLRNIVLCVFTLVESKINYLIRIKLDRHFAELPRPQDGVYEALNILLDEKNYSAKVEVLRTLYKDEKINISFLFALSNIRNAFAHSLSLDDTKYKFKNKNVVEDLYAFDDLVEQSLEIKDKLQSIAERQPEVDKFNQRIQQVIEMLAAAREVSRKKTSA